MLCDRGAKIENGTENPLVIAVSKGNRECFAALIEDHEKDVLNLYDGHSLVYYAIQSDSTLLPLIACLCQREYQQLVEKKEEGNVVFPPKDLNSKEKKKLADALKYEDLYLPYDTIRAKVRQYRSSWKHTKDQPIDGVTQHEESVFTPAPTPNQIINMLQNDMVSNDNDSDSEIKTYSLVDEEADRTGDTREEVLIRQQKMIVKQKDQGNRHTKKKEIETVETTYTQTYEYGFDEEEEMFLDEGTIGQ